MHTASVQAVRAAIARSWRHGNVPMVAQKCRGGTSENAAPLAPSVAARYGPPHFRAP